jgi:hypothetical protein
MRPEEAAETEVQQADRRSGSTPACGARQQDGLHGVDSTPRLTPTIVGYLLQA